MSVRTTERRDQEYTQGEYWLLVPWAKVLTAELGRREGSLAYSEGRVPGRWVMMWG